MFFWLAALQWLRLPYWAVGFGWLALGIYFGCYLPVFIGLSRVGVHVLRLPVILVAPVVYTGLELAQAYLLSGMTMGCLEHSQYRWTMLIQISDLTGCYGVTFLMMFVAACLARMLPCDGRRLDVLAAGPGRGSCRRRARLWPLPHGQRGNRSGPEDRLDPRQHRHRVGRCRRHPRTTDAQYRELTRQAVADYPQIDLIVWPETTFCCVNWVTTARQAP